MREFWQKYREIITSWWSEFTLQTKLMAGITLIVSLLMSSLTFWAVNTIQQDARMNDTRYGSDLGLLLAANVAPLVATDDRQAVAQFSRRFYRSTSSIRYMLYADEEGAIYLGLPFSEAEVKNSLTLRRRIQLPENFDRHNFLPLVRQHITPDGEVTDVFVPLIHDGKYYGVLAIGINPNPNAVISSSLTRDVTLAVFVSIWAMVILGAVFNALTITQPIKELLTGVTNITKGNFKQRIDLPFGGELGELIASFNEMAERLASYEEQNIEELTAEKAKLETLVSTIADGAVLLDTNLQVILVNPTAQRIFGWEGKNVIGANVVDYLPAPVQIELSRPLYQIASGEEEGGEFRCALPEPNKRTIRILLTKVLLHRSSVIDPLCHSCTYNIDDTCTLADRPHADECVLYTDEVEPISHQFNDQDIELNYRESVKGIAMTIQDITREVELNEAKSHFISNVSHELRTPLFNIKSFIETLHDYGDDLSEEQRREFLSTANYETDRLTRLVNDVLDLSRLESCRLYHFEAIDLAQTIEQTMRTYKLNAKDKKIELVQNVQADLPLVLGHYDLLLQVFANLVGNALKFTESGGKVAIHAYSLQPGKLDVKKVDHSQTASQMIVPDHGTSLENSEQNLSVDIDKTDREKQNHRPQFVRIEVADTGSGIDPKDQVAIFERFFRVENQVHTLEGTGLGLSIVKNIIEKHQSQIHIISELGVGTTFWFDLQVYDPSPSTHDKPGVLENSLT